ncbi:MAG: elongation factor G [Chloroflexi bacterium]|nr:elongation factor G [Chloroflexota bacterium]
MQAYGTEQIRNIVLLSHGGAGKTSLSEAALFVSGAVTRLGRVDEGNTVSDFDPDEVKRHISINLSLIPTEWKSHKVNIIDAPGYADFEGEIRAGMAAADGAVLVVCAASGVEVGTEMIWPRLEEGSKPRFIFVNKMDRENADFDRTLSQMQTLFGGKCVALHLPIGSQKDFTGIIDLVKMKAFIGPKAEPQAIPTALADKAASLREKLVEAAAETDDELVTKYLEGEELTEAEIYQGLGTGIREGKIAPVLAGSSLQNIGVNVLLDAICELMPSPKQSPPAKATNPQTHEEVSLPAEATGPLAAQVFKTTADPYTGRLTCLRIYSGTLHSDTHVWNANRARPERLGQLFLLRGKTQVPVDLLVAGDIGAVAKLAETNTSETLCAREQPLMLPPIEFPKPVYSIAVTAKTKADQDKMGSALTRIVEEDPTLTVHKDPDTAETILAGLGETHADVAVEKMRRKFGVDVTTSMPKVSYKETITVQTKAEYKHKKQTGGHGQYGHVFLELEPLPRGSGFEFAEKVVGGVVPKNYIPAVEKGVVESLQEGVVAHCPVVDVRVTLFDGSYHDVDSSDMSFKIAASQAFKKGVGQAQPVLLEPVVNLHIRVPDAYMGETISGLNSKRARVQGTVPEDGTTIIEAQAPLAEVQRYAIDLRSITQGRGSFTMEFSHYEEVPAHIAQKVIAEAAKREREE